MSRTYRLFVILLGALAGIFLLIVAAFGIDRALHAGTVLRHVAASTANTAATTVDLSGLNETEAQVAVAKMEDTLIGEPGRFSIGSVKVDLDPSSVGFDLDEPTVVALALKQGREGSVVDQFGWWLGHLFTKVALPIAASLDEASLTQTFDYWDETVIDDPPDDGGVAIEGTTPVARYPHPGVGVDRAAAGELIADALVSLPRTVVQLPTTGLTPELTAGDVDQAVQEASLMLAGPVTLTHADPDLAVSFKPSELATALRSKVVHNSPAHIQLSFDPNTIESILQPLTDQLGIPPQDASFEISEDGLTVSVVPSKPGRTVDPVLTATELAVASRLPERTGALPFQDAAEPEFTTEDAEALNIRHLVSRFTTYHRCCQNRVTNIHLIADIVDGVIVRPGEEFSINEYVGQRDTARGFLPDHTIVQGKMVDTIGGGVSQFATTFYNAVYWGGYEDIKHSPHSYYFSRYPEGHEATISWPAPNLIFRNDSDAGILIKTSHTDTSLTVSFYGNNGGRTVVGEQKSGRLHVEVLNEGDATARKVTSSVSGRFDVTDPPTEYIPNPDLEPGEEIVDVKGRVGWTVLVTRNIEYPDGHVDKQEWRVRYRPQPREVEVHPCMIPPEEGQEPVECPTTTTTSSPDDSSTTSSTTTTAAGG